MSDYASLIERVRSGSGADRVVDTVIFLDFVEHPKGNICLDDAPPYTSSLDAVVRLVEEKLPGWGYQSGRPIQKYGATGWYATVFREQREDERGEPFAGTYSCPKPLAGDYASTQARALLAALLLALQAQEAS